LSAFRIQSERRTELCGQLAGRQLVTAGKTAASALTSIFPAKHVPDFRLASSRRRIGEKTMQIERHD
jgi:hypothetical protein